MTIKNILSKGFVPFWEQTEKSHLNGIFISFNVTVTENRRDGIMNTYTFYADAGQHKDNSIHTNTTQSRRRRNTGGLPGIAITTPSIGPRGLINNVTNNAINLINKTLNDLLYGLLNSSTNSQQQLQNGIGSDRANASINITLLHAFQRNYVNFSMKSDSFALILTGLLPHTFYNISVRTCTVVGCGPAATTRARTAESRK